MTGLAAAPAAPYLYSSSLASKAPLTTPGPAAAGGREPPGGLRTCSEDELVCGQGHRARPFPPPPLVAPCPSRRLTPGKPSPRRTPLPPPAAILFARRLLRGVSFARATGCGRGAGGAAPRPPPPRGRGTAALAGGSALRRGWQAWPSLFLALLGTEGRDKGSRVPSLAARRWAAETHPRLGLAQFGARVSPCQAGGDSDCRPRAWGRGSAGSWHGAGPPWVSGGVRRSEVTLHLLS